MFTNEDWWSERVREIFWCEITDRDDIGTNLKCPQTNDQEKPFWSYSLIQQVLPGDIIFHYSTREKAFVGASIAGAPLEERPIIWTAHSLPSRKGENENPRPGWWLPLHNLVSLSSPLSLEELRSTENQSWLQDWITRKRTEVSGSLRLPFQLYPGQIRAAQGYLTKMPLDFVDHWPQFAAAAERLSRASERLAASVDFDNPEFSNARVDINFRPKNDSDYVAFIQGGTQQRSRSHETLVRRVGQYLRDRGATIITPHPIDLMMLKPYSVIFEMKVVGMRSPGLLIREAVGQLFEYKYFEKLSDTYGCIVLELNPGPPLISYVEEYLNLGIAWFISGELYFGPKTAQILCMSAEMKASAR